MILKSIKSVYTYITQTYFLYRVSQNWKQTIQSWLKSNEVDDVKHKEYERKRRFVNNNRRSLENDMGLLDTYITGFLIKT